MKRSAVGWTLLIAPEGIEMVTLLNFNSKNLILLIAPEGIEIKRLGKLYSVLLDTLNRTRRN